MIRQQSIACQVIKQIKKKITFSLSLRREQNDFQILQKWTSNIKHMQRGN